MLLKPTVWSLKKAMPAPDRRQTEKIMHKICKNRQKPNNEITRSHNKHYFRFYFLFCIFFAGTLYLFSAKLQMRPRPMEFITKMKNKNHKIKYILALAKYAGPGLIAAAKPQSKPLKAQRSTEP